MRHQRVTYIQDSIPDPEDDQAHVHVRAHGLPTLLQPNTGCLCLMLQVDTVGYTCCTV